MTDRQSMISSWQLFCIASTDTSQHMMLTATDSSGIAVMISAKTNLRHSQTGWAHHRPVTINTAMSLPLPARAKFAAIMLVMAAVLTACQPQQPDNARPQISRANPTSPQIPKSEQAVSSGREQSISTTLSQSQEDDIVGTLIDEIEAAEKISAETEDITTSSSEQISPAQEADIFFAPSSEDAAEQGGGSRASQALDAALDLLKSKTAQAQPQLAPFSLPPKSETQIRVGLLVPFSGVYQQLGQQIAGGVELALFQTGSQAVELAYFDTSGGLTAAEAARNAVAADVDIVIGPLFTDAVSQARPILSGANIPVLALSNNLAAAAPGNWVLGYLPEQQLDHLLGHVVSAGKSRIAIVSSEDQFGEKLRAHAEMRIADLGLSQDNVLILSQPTLDDEDSLKASLRQFSGYVTPQDDDTAELPPALYDAVILAGNREFVLRVAPVLDYYDLGPSRATFIGTDLWSRPELISEPSLQGSLISAVILGENDSFTDLWSQSFESRPSGLARLGFDSLAIIIVTSREAEAVSQIDWRRSLLRDEGFAGFSGTFKLLPDGRNQRDFSLYRIEDGQLQAF